MNADNENLEKIAEEIVSKVMSKFEKSAINEQNIRELLREEMEPLVQRIALLEQKVDKTNASSEHMSKIIEGMQSIVLDRILQLEKSLIVFKEEVATSIDKLGIRVARLEKVVFGITENIERHMTQMNKDLDSVSRSLKGLLLRQNKHYGDDLSK